MEETQSKNVGMKQESGQAATAGGDTLSLQKFLAIKDRYVLLQDRHASLVEFQAGLKELFSRGQMWVKEQADFEKNDFKKSMFLAFCEMVSRQLLRLGAEALEISLTVESLRKQIKGEEKLPEEVSHG